MLEERILMPDPDSAVLVRKRLTAASLQPAAAGGAGRGRAGAGAQGEGLAGDHGLAVVCRGASHCPLWGAM